MSNSDASSATSLASQIPERALRLLGLIAHHGEDGKVAVPRWSPKYSQWRHRGELWNREAELLIGRGFACTFHTTYGEYGLRATKEGEAFYGLGSSAPKILQDAG